MHRFRSTAFALALWTASACGTPGAPRPSQLELQGDGGFVITEKVRVGGGVRADFERAVQLLEHNQHAEGIALLVEVTKAAPELTAAHIDLGIAYGRVNDLEQAEASLKRALELSPRHPVAHNELGIVYRKTGRFAEARRSYEQALALHPGFHFARRNLAILCDVYLADLRCALENYQAYANAVPDDDKTAIWLADVRNRIGGE